MAKDLAKRPDGEVEAAREYSPKALVIQERAKATGYYADLNPFLLQALEADTIEAATSREGVLSGRDDVIGERLRIVGVTFLDADPTLDSALPFYAVIDCIREMTGERVKVSIGADQPTGVLLRACEQGWFPFDAELESVKLGGVKKAINLVLAPTRVDAITEDL